MKNRVLGYYRKTSATQSIQRLIRDSPIDISSHQQIVDYPDVDGKKSDDCETRVLS